MFQEPENNFDKNRHFLKLEIDQQMCVFYRVVSRKIFVEIGAQFGYGKQADELVSYVVSSTLDIKFNIQFSICAPADGALSIPTKFKSKFVYAGSRSSRTQHDILFLA